MGEMADYYDPDMSLRYPDDETDRHIDVLDVLDALARTAYWFYKMIEQGGPDGSDLDEAVVQDMQYQLALHGYPVDVEEEGEF